MNLKKYYTILILVFVIFCACEKDKPNPFLIENHHIGFLTDSTQVKDLKIVFPNDSIVNFKAGDEFSGTINAIDIYEKNGTKLLSLYPKEALDSTSVIGSVQILDKRYRTDQNINIESTFKDIKDAYKIKSIDNLINIIVVNVKDINGAFTIDKNELPPNMRFDMKIKFDPIMIPDEAKVKFFMLHW